MPLFVVTHTTDNGDHPVFLSEEPFEFYAIMRARQARHPGQSSRLRLKGR